MWLSINPKLEPYPRWMAALWVLKDEKTYTLDITPEQLANGYNALEELGFIPHEIYLSVESEKERKRAYKRISILV